MSKKDAIHARARARAATTRLALARREHDAGVEAVALDYFVAATDHEAATEAVGRARARMAVAVHELAAGLGETVARIADLLELDPTEVRALTRAGRHQTKTIAPSAATPATATRQRSIVTEDACTEPESTRSVAREATSDGSSSPDAAAGMSMSDDPTGLTSQEGRTS